MSGLRAQIVQEPMKDGPADNCEGLVKTLIA